VLWVNPYPTRFPSLRDILSRENSTNQAVTGNNSSVHCLSIRALPVEPLPMGGWVNRCFFWADALDQIDSFVSGGDCELMVARPTKLSLYLLDRYQFARTYYDAMDDFPEFYRGCSRYAMRKTEIALVDRVDRIYVSSTYLQKKFERLGYSPSMILNACDVICYTSAFKSDEGSTQTVLGYIGSMGDWFNWELVITMAYQLPQCLFRLVGPVFGNIPTLPENIELLPACPHEDVGRILQGFDIGLIPFKLNELTRSVDPIKYYEYRAMGLPVLTTTFGEMINHAKVDSGVHTINAAVELSLPQLVSWVQREHDAEVCLFRERHSWNTRLKNSGVFNCDVA